MGNSTHDCVASSGVKKGLWTPAEDQKLLAYVQKHGHGNWQSLPQKAGLQRCGKSCRLRWRNYLRPDIKRGNFSLQEDQTIIQLHALLGNRWSAITAHLPKRTDNEVKNYWHSRLKKRLALKGYDPVTHKPKNTIFGFANGSTDDPKTGSNLNHIAQWESVRLQAEARYVRDSELHKQAYHPYNNNDISTASSILSCYNEDFGQNLPQCLDICSFGNRLAGDFEPPIISAISNNGSSLMDCFVHEPVGQCLEDFGLWEIIMQGKKDCPISGISGSITAVDKAEHRSPVSTATDKAEHRNPVSTASPEIVVNNNISGPNLGKSRELVKLIMALFQLRTLCLCLLLLVFKTCIAGEQHKDRTYPGFQASQMDCSDNGGLFLLSNNSAFALGFYQALDVKLYLLVVIHLGTSKVVWTANRGLLISNSDKFAFDKNGNAYLRSSNNLVWSTNTTGEVVSAMQLQDSGNLVYHLWLLQWFN
ncbi:unnamed protein product [Prunus brigantina]